MPEPKFSVIIPVYNRPQEVKEILRSLAAQTVKDFEVIIVEDGSAMRCEDIVDIFRDQLRIEYFFKPNTGPGPSRNAGFARAKGNYFVVFDSDCILPSDYFAIVSKALEENHWDAWGGPDKAHEDFTLRQRAMGYTMSSVLTTGGIRGGKKHLGWFQPRSFNMGISKKAFEASKGFSNIHPGEDPDLSIRLWNLGFETRLFPNAYVYHKRRIDWDKFSLQVNKFGKARPILNSWYPQYNKLTFFFPTVFIIGFFVSLVLLIFNQDILLKIYFCYFLALFLLSSIQNKSVKIGYLSIIAAWKQFYGYGLGFLKSYFKIIILKQDPKKAFPELFFKN